MATPRKYKRKREKAPPIAPSQPSSPELTPTTAGRKSFAFTPVNGASSRNKQGHTATKPSTRIDRPLPSNSEAASVSDLDGQDSATSSSDSEDSLLHIPLLNIPKGNGNASMSNDSERRLSSSSATGLYPTRRDLLKEKPPPTQNHFVSMFESTQNSINQYLPLNTLARSESPIPLRRKTPSPSVAHIKTDATSGNTYSAPPSPRIVIQPQTGGGPRFRLDILFEVTILTVSMTLACWRIASLPTPIASMLPPAIPLIIITILMPFMTLFRRSAPATHLMVPFTDERGYRARSAADDGFAAGVGLPILIAAGFVWEAAKAANQDTYLMLENLADLVDIWISAGLSPEFTRPTSSQLAHTLLDARICLLVLITLNVFVLILHLVLARTVLRVNWLPLSNTKRFFGALALASGISTFAGVTTALCAYFGHASPYVNPLELTISSFVYQISLYLVSRLARRGFTLGELALTVTGGVCIALEFWRLLRARFLYASSPDIPATFRSPTPLIAYQHVMIAGVFLAGFLLSPLLVVSRHLASKPSHRMRFPAEKERHRKLLAAGVLLGITGIIIFMFGSWLAWILKGGLRKPWSWAIRFTVYGGDGLQGMRGELRGWRKWKRLFLSIYWLAIAFAAVGGWQTRIVRQRRIKMSQTGERTGVEAAREEKKTHVSLDYRRKFFHALAVIMFVPGIAIDSAFTSLAFSLAFSVFTFAEYARYFALYPIGAPIHVFFSEFVDNKDSGPVVLSHFYLLTGCAAGLWMEGRGIKRYAGVLALGVGDAMASILGKRVGGPKWPGTSKTLAGTFAFVSSVYCVSWLLVALGCCEPFQNGRYLLATILAGLFEATSSQNDNLMIPIYFWAMQSLLETV